MTPEPDPDPGPGPGGAPRASAAAELKARIDAERRGAPFIVYRDREGAQVLLELGGHPAGVSIGRRPENDVALGWDREVSRVHAQLEPLGRDWMLVDEGLSANGSWVNGERVAGRRRLRDGDRLCFGATQVAYRAPSPEESESTQIGAPGVGSTQLTETQRRVLIELCRPLARSAFEPPATNKEIADALFLSVDAVKAHLRGLFERFGLEQEPQNKKRARLAEIALVHRVVLPHDL